MNGTFIQEFRQFSRPSGIFIKNDILYVADSESESVSRNHNGWKRGIRIGNLRTGQVTGFIPDPVDKTTGTSAAEGVAVDKNGKVWASTYNGAKFYRYNPSEPVALEATVPVTQSRIVEPDSKSTRYATLPLFLEATLNVSV